MPALGTNMPMKKIIALKPFYDFAVIWLDSDKWQESMEMAERFKWVGFKATAIYSDLDPKAYSNDELYQFLTK